MSETASGSKFVYLPAIFHPVPLAYPCNISYVDENGVTQTHISMGMSLRDYFAAQALAGILASPQLITTKPAPELALNCYAIADAMLAERAKS